MTLPTGPGTEASGNLEIEYGWDTRQADFDDHAGLAAELVRALTTREVREAATGVVEHLVVGVDIFHPHGGPYAETASLYDVAADTVRRITGKSYPNAEQQDDLIRDRDAGSHIVEIGGERVAVLVCHDLAAWSPRGNAVATSGRKAAWEAMQEGVRAVRPTLAVLLPHTVDTPRTWAASWSRFAERSGGELRSATSAIRHLHKGEQPVGSAVPASLLARTSKGEPPIDVIVTGAGDRP